MSERDGRMPVVFVGHGSPMNAIEDNRWSRGFSALGDSLPRPESILAVSAHWFVDGTYVTGNARPKTIHDFSGFPQSLYEIDYPAPGDVGLAKRVCTLLDEEDAALDSRWGIDHGTWSVLRWTYPEAEIPVIQLSINRRLEVRRHYELGRSLATLRDEGVLILASGNVTHNLRDAIERRRQGSTETPDWAQRFDSDVEQAIVRRDTSSLLDLWPGGDHGRQAHPTPDHWFPLLYAYGASDDNDSATFQMQGFDWGSLSMRSIVLG